MWGRGGDVGGVWSMVEGNIMYVASRAAVDQRGVGGRWGPQAIHSLLDPPHRPDTAPSGPPHPMRWAAQRIGHTVQRHLGPDLGHPSRQHASRCEVCCTQRTAMRGVGGYFPRPTLSAPTVKASWLWTARGHALCDPSCPRSRSDR